LALSLITPTLLRNELREDNNTSNTDSIAIPAILTVIESHGSTSLTQVGNNYFLYANGTSSGPELTSTARRSRRVNLAPGR